MKYWACFFRRRLKRRLTLSKMDKEMIKTGKVIKVILPNGNARYTASPFIGALLTKKYGKGTRILNLLK